MLNDNVSALKNRENLTFFFVFFKSPIFFFLYPSTHTQNQSMHHTRTHEKSNWLRVQRRGGKHQVLFSKCVNATRGFFFLLVLSACGKENKQSSANLYK